MATKLTYYDFALEDFKYLEDAYNCGLRYSPMTSQAQNTAERFLKHILKEYVEGIEEDSEILRTHSIKKLYAEITQELPDFRLKRNCVAVINGYYFEVRYPGDSAFIASTADVEDCYAALIEIKEGVECYMQTHLSITDKVLVYTRIVNSVDDAAVAKQLYGKYVAEFKSLKELDTFLETEGYKSSILVKEQEGIKRLLKMD